MTTNADIVRRAARLMGVVASGASPTGADAADSMDRLQGLILDLPGLSLGAIWHEVAASAAYTAREGQRVTMTGAFAVTLPATINPTCDEVAGFSDPISPGFGLATRPPIDFSRVQVIGGTTPGLFVYIASLGAWSQLDNLTIGGDFPFGHEDVEGVAAMLAVDMADEYGSVATVGPRTVAKASIAARSLRARFKKAGPSDWSRPSLYDMPRRRSDYY